MVKTKQKKLTREEIIEGLRGKDDGYQFGRNGEITFVVSEHSGDLTVSKTYPLGELGEGVRPTPMVCYDSSDVMCTQIFYAEILRRNLTEIGAEPMIAPMGGVHIERIRGSAALLTRVADKLEKISKAYMSARSR